jgi:ribonuclease T2
MSLIKKAIAISLLLSTSMSYASGQAGKFDFYVLTLSWSPDYCAAKNDNDLQQCTVGKKLGFVLHGLWPQYTQGFPSDCSNEKLTKDAKAKFPGLYPSDALYAHEWEKHGTCSGLGPQDYLAFSKKLKESITIPANYQSPSQPFRTTPAALKKDFVAANPKLSDNALAVYCSGAGRFLKEVFFCYSSKGEPVACSQEVFKQAGKSCGQKDLLVRNVK